MIGLGVCQTYYEIIVYIGEEHRNSITTNIGFYQSYHTGITQHQTIRALLPFAA